jgi:hypothetical protein
MRTIVADRDLSNVPQPADFESSLIKAVARVVPASASPMSALKSAASEAKWMAFAAAAMEPERSKRIIEGLRMHAQATAGLFAAAKAMHEGPLIINVGPHTIDVPTRHDPDLKRYVTPSRWTAGLYAACAVREERTIKTLLGLAPEPSELAIKGLRELMQRSPAAGETLRAAEIANAHQDDEVTALELPVLALAACIHNGEPRAINEALAHALERHRAYWTSVDPDTGSNRRDDVDGFLALGPLGLACLAHDRGVPIEVESDYAPGWIIRREW